MPRTYEGHGVSAAYPDNWQAEVSETDDGWSVLLQSPGTAFVQLIGQERQPGEGAAAACRSVLDSTLAALREDYPDLETEPAVEMIAGKQAIGEDVRFISLDLTASCWLRALSLPDQTLLVLCQTSDLELTTAEPVFRAIRASLKQTE